MPGKSKHKKFNHSSIKRTSILQTSPSTTTQATTTGAPAVSKSSSAPVKNIPSAGKQAGAQYTVGQFKYVGTELKVAGILSAIILIIIIVLYFVLH